MRPAQNRTHRFRETVLFIRTTVLVGDHGGQKREEDGKATGTFGLRVGVRMGMGRFSQS